MTRTFSLIGVSAEPVHVELDINRGLPAFSIVGLPDTAVRESRERVRAALVNSGFDFPLQRITANLAPADLRKAGPGFDLAIAAAVLAASGQLKGSGLDAYAFGGELALDGSIRSVPGVLAMTEAARSWGMRGVVVAQADAAHASLVEGISVIPLACVGQLVDLAAGRTEGFAGSAEPPPPPSRRDDPDLRDLLGQPVLRHALEVAAAGGHSLLVTGPPGAGKTMAARRLPSLLPALEGEELLEVARIAGVCGEHGAHAGRTRPFRAPHHTCSAASLIGGGTPLRPGEITRAHRGVLFLDELGEFRRDALEALRQPLEQGAVRVSRAGRTMELPARFTLVAAANPCPCGRGEDSGECECHPARVRKYQDKLSGALADRIDISIAVDRPGASQMAADPGEDSAAVRARVLEARELQAVRLGPGRTNAEITPEQAREHCVLGAEAGELLAEGHRRLGLSGRGWDRIVRVARTLADLAGSEGIESGHIAGALSLRRRGTR